MVTAGHTRCLRERHEVPHERRREAGRLVLDRLEQTHREGGCVAPIGEGHLGVVGNRQGGYHPDTTAVTIVGGGDNYRGTDQVGRVDGGHDIEGSAGGWHGQGTPQGAQGGACRRQGAGDEGGEVSDEGDWRRSHG